MRALMYAMSVLVPLTSILGAAPLSDVDLKNLLAGIRQNRSTQADFQEQRVIRLMKKPILSSGRIWFQPPNKFRREVKGNPPSFTVAAGPERWINNPTSNSAGGYPFAKGWPLDATGAAIISAFNLKKSE